MEITNFEIPNSLDSYTYDIKFDAYKKLAVCKFECIDNIIKFEISVNNKICIMIINNELSYSNFWEKLGTPSPDEAIFDFLFEQLRKYYYDYIQADSQKPIIDYLKRYKDEHYKCIQNCSTKRYFKLYSKTKIVNGERSLHKSGWIDYEKQLGSGDIIYDSNNSIGLFAQSSNTLVQLLRKDHKEKYGDFLLVLEPIKDLYYMHTKLEIIGDKFKVIKKIDTSKIDFSKDPNTEELIQAILEEKDLQIAELKNEHKTKDDSLNYIKDKYYSKCYELKKTKIIMLAVIFFALLVIIGNMF